MRKHLLMVSAAMALCGGQGAVAGSQGYIVRNWAPAMNNVDDSGCPEGRNPGPRDVMIASLKERGMPQEEIDKLTDPAKMNTEAYGRYMARRGKVKGQAASVYHYPLSAPDTNIKLDQAKEGFGFNLDGKDGLLNYTDPLTLETGVDNIGARVFGCFDRTRGTHKTPPGNWTYRFTTHYAAGYSWLIEVTSNSSEPLDFQNEDNVTVTFHRGMQPPITNGNGYQRNVTYTIDPDSRLKSLTSFNGKIRNRVFTAEVTPQFRMIASPRVHPVFDFKSVHMRMTFNPDGGVEGFVGGYVPIDQVYFPFGSYGVYAEYLGGMDVSGLYHAMQKYADTDIDLDPKTGKRTRISQTYQLAAVPAFLTRISTAIE